MFEEDEFGRFHIDVGREIGRTFEGAAHRARERVGDTVRRAGHAAGDAARTVDKHVRGRALTAGELAMIQAMFGTTKGFTFARIFPFNFWWPYPNDRAMTPNGSIYFPRHDYRDDYSAATVSVSLKALFLHESTHLYQTYVLGYHLMFSGPFDRNYEYKIVPGQKLRDYGIEQMGQMVQDYYRLKHGVKVPGGVYRAEDYKDALPVKAE